MNFPIRFSKMSGTGNDFIIIDHRRPVIPEQEQATFARAVCRRNFSVGADGLILIEEAASADFSWRFFNADGSLAEMCGNGARCAARFAALRGIAGTDMRFDTLAGTIKARVDGETVTVGLTPPQDQRLDLAIVLAGQDRTIHFVNTGVPHVVMFTDLQDLPIKDWGREIRCHEMFQPAGTNVNFVQRTGPANLVVRTYERGVEDETMACGTGATAAAVIAAALGMIEPPVTVTTSGGQRLVIHFTLDEEKRARDLHLEGPALHIYDGELQEDALQP